jgi:hypothetical protein
MAVIFNQVPKLRERIPAHFLGENLEDAIRLIERLVVAPTVFPTAIPVDETYQAVAQLYLKKRPLIEIALLEKLRKDDLHIEHLNETNAYFGNGLSAALELGDPAFLESDLEWVKRLLAGRHMSADRLTLAACGQSTG